MEYLARLVQRVGPYVAIAVLVPGGTFIVLGMYFFRRQRAGYIDFFRRQRGG